MHGEDNDDGVDLGPLYIPQLAEAVGTELVRSELVNAYVALLKDNEAEVRTAGAGQIPGASFCLLTIHMYYYISPIWLVIGFSKLVERDTILAKILPCVQALSTDSSQHVRAALGTHISGLAPLLGKEATIDHLLPLFLQLLKDDFPDVRLNIISKLELVNNGTFVYCLSLTIVNPNGEQSSVLTSSLNPFFPQSSSWQRTNNGVFGRRSSNIFPCSPPSLASNSSMSSLATSACLGLGILCFLSGRPPPST